MQCILCSRAFQVQTLKTLVWYGAALALPVCAVLSQACLPLLTSLSVDHQGLDSAGVADLLQVKH